MSEIERGCDGRLESGAMGGISEVGGLLNLAGIGIKRRGMGGSGANFGAKRQKNTPAVKKGGAVK